MTQTGSEITPELSPFRIEGGKEIPFQQLKEETLDGILGPFGLKSLSAREHVEGFPVIHKKFPNGVPACLGPVPGREDQGPARGWEFADRSAHFRLLDHESEDKMKKWESQGPGDLIPNMREEWRYP